MQSEHSTETLESDEELGALSSQDHFMPQAVEEHKWAIDDEHNNIPASIFKSADNSSQPITLATIAEDILQGLKTDKESKSLYDSVLLKLSQSFHKNFNTEATSADEEQKSARALRLSEAIKAISYFPPQEALSVKLILSQPKAGILKAASTDNVRMHYDDNLGIYMLSGTKSALQQALEKIYFYADLNQVGHLYINVVVIHGSEQYTDKFLEGDNINNPIAIISQRLLLQLNHGEYQQTDFNSSGYSYYAESNINHLQPVDINPINPVPLQLSIFETPLQEVSERNIYTRHDLTVPDVPPAAPFVPHPPVPSPGSDGNVTPNSPIPSPTTDGSNSGGNSGGGGGGGSDMQVAALTDSDITVDTVSENAANGTVVGVTAFTIDPEGAVVTYSLTNNAGGRFTINTTTGVVTVADGTLLNYEAATSHMITVSATDGTTAAVTQNLTITISNVDEQLGTISDSNAGANSVAENVTNGTVVGMTALATDPEGAAITYSLTNDAGGRFAINSTTGVVTVADGTLLNYEAATSHNITVSATDGTTTAVTQNFTITLSNVDEVPPVLSDSNAAANTISENAANGTVVGVTALAVDPESATITYSLTDDAGGRFAINSSNGIVTVANGTLLNYETATSHSITVSATDGTTAPITQNYTITITNIDEQPAALTDTDATADAVNENAANGTVVGITGLTTDPEGTAITYSLSNSAGGRFAINSSTGVVTVANSTLLNYESATSHVITISATDGTTAPVTQNYTITINNVDEQPGTITDSNGAANSVNENAANGTVVGMTALATDPESVAITYSLTNDAGGRFAINSATGVVTVADGSLLNYETATSHMITVSATDGTTAAITQNFTINIANVNEAPAAITDNNAAANAVDESAVNGTVVGITTFTSDPEGTAITYSLTDNAGGRFAIHATTGVVTVANGALLDYETNTSHNITVQATDGINPVTQTFTININDLNEVPVFTGLAASVTYMENTVNAAPQLLDSDVTLTDGDSADFNGGSVTVTWTSGGGTQDQLSVTNIGNGAGQIGVAGVTVSYGGTAIGTITSNGVNGATLTITLNASATPVAVEALIEALTYANNSDNPNPARTATISVNDGDSGSVAQASIVVNVTAETDPGLTFNLTVGVDNFTGAGLDDTFTGVTANLNATDTLAGAGGFDVIEITNSAGIAAGIWVNKTGIDGLRLLAGATNLVFNDTIIDASDSGNRFVIDNGATAISGSGLNTAGVSASNDIVIGGTGAVTMANAASNRVVSADGVNTSITGGTGADTIIGGSGNDTFLGGTGSDSIHGGSGTDRVNTFITDFIVGDTLDGGTGLDTLAFTSVGIINSANFANKSGFETILLGNGMNTLTLNAGYTIDTGSSLTIDTTAAIANAQIINVNASSLSVSVIGALGNDSFTGGSGSDTLRGDAGSDTLAGGGGSDTLYGGVGSTDLFKYLAAAESANATPDFIADFTPGDNDLIDLVALGFTGIQAGAAAGTVLGYTNDGTNTTIVDSGGTFRLILSGVMDPSTYLLLNNGLTLTASTTDNLSGTAGSDLFTTASANIHNGDTITAGTGTDILYFTDGTTINTLTMSNKTGIDIFRFGANQGSNITISDTTVDATDSGNSLELQNGSYTLGNLTISATGGNNVYIAGNGAVTMSSGGRIFVKDGVNGNITGSGGGSDTITGGTGNDSLSGGGGNGIDSLTGGGGADTLTGGPASDTFDYNAISDSAFAAPDRITDFSVLTANDIIDLSGLGFTGIQSGAAAGTVLGYTNNGVDTTIVDAANTFRIVLTGVQTGIEGNFIFIPFTLTAGTDNFTGSGAFDTFVTVEANFQAADTLVGGAGLDSLYYQNAATILAAELANKTGIDRIILGATANSIILTDAFIDASDSGNRLEIANGDFSISSLNLSAVSASNDVVIAGSAQVTLAAGFNNRVLIKDGVNGVISGASGNDTIIGGSGNDFLGCGSGNDSVMGGSGNDTIDGGNNNDTINGGTGIDSLTGGALYDTFAFSAIGDSAFATPDRIVDFNTGFDVIDLTALGFTGIQAGAAAGTVLGYTNNGMDTTIVDAANTFRIVLTGVFTLDGSIRFIASNTGTLTAGSDSIILTAGADVVSGQAGHLSGSDTITAGAGTDVLRLTTVASGADSVDGGKFTNITGIDILEFGINGNQVAVTDAMVDQTDNGNILYLNNLQYTITSLDTSALSAGNSVGIVGSGVVTLANANNRVFIVDGNTGTVTGGTGNDTIIGGTFADSISGGTGIDSLTGGAGADRFYYGAGEFVQTETLAGGTGTDTIYFSTGVTLVATEFDNKSGIEQFFFANAVNATTISGSYTTETSGVTFYGNGSTGGNTLNLDGAAVTTFGIVAYGGAAADTLIGGSGTDNFTGNGSSDSLIGGAGNDTFSYASGEFIAAETVDGGLGTDIVSFQGTIVAGDLTNKTGIETFTVSTGNASITISAGHTIDTGTTLSINSATSITNTLFADMSATSINCAITSNTIFSNNDTLTGGSGNDTITSASGNDTVTGNAGSDSIVLGSDGTVDSIRYNTINDGAVAGANTGQDTLSGFDTGADILYFGSAFNGGANNLDDITADDNFTFVIGGAANFNTTHEALQVSGLANADLTQAGFTNVLAAINALGITASLGQDGLILIRGTSNSAIFYYEESEAGGNTLVTSGELRLIAVSNGLLTSTNFDFY